MNRLLLLSIFILLIPPVGGQASPLPSVSIECEGGPHEIDVFPGADMATIVICTVSNDSIHSETVEFSVSADDLSFTAPDNVDLSPGSEEEIQITFRGDSSKLPGSRTVDINATITTANGIPCTIGCGEASESFEVEIQQFSSVSVASRTGTLNLEVDTSGEVMFDITNEGNTDDDFSVNIENESGLDSLGFQFVLNSTGTLKPGEQAPYSFEVYASPDVSETNVQVVITVISKNDPTVSETIQFTLRSDGAPEPIISLAGDDTALLYGGISVAGLLITILVLFIAMRSMRRRKVVSFSDEFEDFSDLDDF